MVPEQVEEEIETEASAEEVIAEESSSIKDKIVKFFQKSEETEIEVQPEAEEETVEAKEVDDIEESKSKTEEEMNCKSGNTHEPRTKAKI